VHTLMSIVVRQSIDNWMMTVWIVVKVVSDKEIVIVIAIRDNNYFVEIGGLISIMG